MKENSGEVSRENAKACLRVEMRVGGRRRCTLLRHCERIVGWAKALLRRAHHLATTAMEVVGTLSLCPPYKPRVVTV